MIAIDPMPDRCGICPCFHAADPMHCQATDPDPEKGIVAPYRDPRPEWCPLEEQKKPKRESKAMLPCKCGGKRWEHWYSSAKGAGLRCKKCGFEVWGKDDTDVIKKWNEAVKQDETD